MISKPMAEFYQQSFFRRKLLLILMLAFQLAAFGQEKLVKGTVTDASGVALPGVNVVIQGTQTGTITDIDGKFAINVRGEADVLVFSYVGYLDEKVSVGSQTEVNINLQEDILQLNEVVVVGYGTQKKSDLTGVVTSVNAEELQKTPVVDIQTALQGRASGVQVSQNTGAPGSNVTIRIRGITSITSGTNPLWIVDGVPAGPNSVNPSDIESIEILKDASSAAIYGSAGANGVILITTKKGKPGKVIANMNFYQAVQNVPNRIDVATGPEFGEMFTEIEEMKFRNMKPTQSGYRDFRFPDYQNMPDYDYQDLVFRRGSITNADFNVSGGNESSNFYMGIGYFQEKGILEKTGFRKINFRVNSDHKVNKWLKVGETFSFATTITPGFAEWQYTNEYATPILGAIQFHPYLPPYDSTGNFTPKTTGSSENPMPTIDLLEREDKYYSSNGLVYLTLMPLKGLSIESRISGSLGFSDNYNFHPTYEYGGGPGQYNRISSLDRDMRRDFSYNWQNIICYGTSIFCSINLTAMGGYEVGEYQGLTVKGSRQYLLNETEDMWYFDAGDPGDTTTAPNFAKGGGDKTAGWSLFGRLSLDYRGIFLVQGNIRRDLSSKFGPENRVGVFPSFSMGIKFSEFEFIKNLNVLNFGKIRYGWGKVGNNNIRSNAYYGTVGVLETFQYSFVNSSTLATGAAPDVLANKAVHWESIVTNNIGFDLAFLNNRLNLTIDRFSRHNVGMLVSTNIPGYAGYVVRDTYQESHNVDPRPVTNIGKISNKGWELTVGWKDNVGKLKYDFDINYTYIKNKVEDLGKDSIYYDGGIYKISGNLTRTVIGQEIGEFYGLEVEKIFQLSDTGRLENGTQGIINQPSSINPKGEKVYAQPNAQPGDFKFRDVNNDGKITNLDMVALGNGHPKHFLGINMNFNYGLFELTMFWQGTFGNKLLNGSKISLFNQDGNYNWLSDYIYDHYRPQELIATDAEGKVLATFPANTDAAYPRVDPTNKNNNFGRLSDFYIEDGSYFRLKNIQLAMSLPKSWVTKATLGDFKIYCGARNLLTFTKYTGMDPEVNNSGGDNSALVTGIDRASYPQARVFFIGAKIQF